MYKRVLYLVGPTCAGKTTVAEMLCKCYGYSSVKSTTTRERRSFENEALMNFISEDEFKEGIKDCEFIEYAEYSGNFYGTRREDVSEALSTSCLAVKVIEIKGLISILSSGFHEATGIGYSVVYINPKFEGYQLALKSRSDYQERLNRDKCLKDLFTQFIAHNKFVNRSNIYFMDNKGDIGEFVAKVNSSCMFTDIEHRVESTLLRLPSNVSLTKSEDSCKFSVVFIDRYRSNIRSLLHIRSEEDFDIIGYLYTHESDLVNYCSKYYLVCSLDFYGMIAVINYNVR